MKSHPLLLLGFLAATLLPTTGQDPATDRQPGGGQPATTTPHAAAPSVPPDSGPVPSAALDDAKKFQLAAGLHLEVWAAEPALENPVAFSLVPLLPQSLDQPPGVAAFVAETHRYGISVFDITQNTPWLLDDLSLRTVGDRAAFLARQFATNTALLTRESEQIRRLADVDGDGRAEASSVFARDFASPTDGTAAGILARGTNIWFANIPNLWRLAAPAPAPDPASTAAPRPPGRTVLATGFGVHIGVTGHDLHGLVPGPDGRLYLSFGDRGVHLDTREGGRIDLPDTGGVLRCEPDGRNLEVFCTGLRNPQELAFDDLGNLFTVDNDTAGADHCRVLHLVEGADYGWRASYQHMKGFGPWVREGLWAGGLDGILPPAGQVSQGPAGLAWYPGTGFGDRFRDRFLHADFPGGIWSFGLSRRGASYAVSDPRKVLWNCWPTDVEFGPDGALYVLDWVGGWGLPHRGRIYRLTPDTPDSNPAIHRLLGESPAGRKEDALLALLAHPDRRVRLDAQFELARRGPDSFRGLRTVAFGSESTLPRLHALWAVGQLARDCDIGRSGGDLSDELASLLRLLDDADEAVAGAAARVLTDAQLIHADLPVAALLGEPSPRLRFEAAMGMGSLMSESHRASATLPQKASRWLEEHLPRIGRLATRHVDQSVGFHPGWDSMRDFVRTNCGGDPFLECAAARHFERLERLEASWPSYTGLSGSLRARTQDPQAGVRRAALLALRRLTNAAAADLLADPDPRIALEAARAIHDVPIPAALPRLAALLGSPAPDATDAPAPAWLRIPDQTLADHLAGLGLAQRFSAPLPTNTAPMRHQFLARVLDAHFRLGQPTNAAALAAFVASTTSPSHPPAARAEALFLLAHWGITAAAPGAVPATIVPDPNHGMVPTINPENWPGWFDRVVGLWRPLPPRPPDAARTALAPFIDRLLLDPDPTLASAALDATVRLRLTHAAPTLLDRLQNPATPIAFRRSVPAALASLDSALVGPAVETALADPDPELRAAAVPLTDRLPAREAIPRLRGLVEDGLRPTGSRSLAQAAITALGRRPEADADAPVADLLARLADGTLPPEMALETLEAARARSDAGIQDRLRQLTPRESAADPVAAWSDTLFGGDPARGRAVFVEKVEVQCTRCHRVRGEGGIVGPPLDGVARRADRRQLLESILAPNARFAPGFETATLTLADGREVSGTIRAETPTELVVAGTEDGEVRVPAAQVVGRRRGLSAMPEGLPQLLARRELRDLVAYLASLRE